jgi:hypothetical protein
MDIYERQHANEGSMNENIPQALEQQRRQVERLAHTLSQQATDQWRKAVEGMVALPAAMAVGIAATALYAVGFVTRGFEVFQRSAMEAGQRMGDSGEEARRRERQRGEQQRETGRNEVGRPETFPSA